MKRAILDRLVFSLRKRFSERPAAPGRRDVISLLSAQEFAPEIDGSIRSKTLLADGSVQKPPLSWSENLADVAPQWICHPVYAYRLQNVAISLDNGNIHFPTSGKYVLETSWGWAKYRTASVGTFRPNMVRRIENEKPIYVFSGRGYHGVMEDLSSLLYLSERGERFDVVIDAENNWMRKLLEVFLPASVKVILAVRHSWIAADEFIVTTKSAFGEFVHPVLIQTLNRASRAVTDAQVAKRIFISRADSLKRRFGDESSLGELFAEYGFDVVNLSNLSARDQIALFKAATAVAGLHGAGFANLVWCQKKVKVLEIYDRTHFNSCYSSLSYVLDHEYQNVSIATNGMSEHRKDHLESLLVKWFGDQVQPFEGKPEIDS